MRSCSSVSARLKQSRARSHASKQASWQACKRRHCRGSHVDAKSARFITRLLRNALLCPFPHSAPCEPARTSNCSPRARGRIDAVARVTAAAAALGCGNQQCASVSGVCVCATVRHMRRLKRASGARDRASVEPSRAPLCDGPQRNALPRIRMTYDFNTLCASTLYVLLRLSLQASL